MTKPESAGYEYDVVISGAGLAGSAGATPSCRTRTTSGAAPSTR
ncbi:hypothetical protein ACGFYQ_28180 [Streptomyces sp. NPDC048258]